jgi:toxin FitB
VYLLDTNVLSAATPNRAPRAPIVQWMDAQSNRLHLSTISIAEIESGIAKARRTGAKNRADLIAQWLGQLLHLYGSRVLAFDVDAARIAGALIDATRAKGAPIGFPDVAIAATAKCKGLVVLTQNLKHFKPLGVRAHDPFVSLPT